MRTYRTPWGALPLVEAQADLELNVQPKHIAAGIAGDENACALAQAALEQTAASMVRIERTVAYVMYKDRVERYMLKTHARNAVIEFDITNGASAPVGPITLSKPSEAQTLDRMREVIEAWDKRSGGKRHKRGRWGTAHGTYIDTLGIVGVRSGKGGAHTLIKEVKD